MQTVIVDSAVVNPTFSSNELSLADFSDDSSAIGYSAIPAMFSAASSKLKHPKLLLGELTLKLATGPRTNWPGSVHVLVDSRYHATISVDGTLYVRHPLPPEASMLLLRLAADPIATTLKQGQLQGRCAFCRRSLTDPRSACHGFGQRCAEIWGLRWDAPRACKGMFGDVWSAVSGAELVGA